MGLIKKWKEFREYEQRATTLEELLLEASVDINTITKEQALSIPSVSSAVNIITNTIATIPIYLYKEENGKVTQVKNDNRVKLLNDDTRDTLDAFQFKLAVIEDFLLLGGGYAYINKQRNDVISLNYVEKSNISINKNIDPIFKDYDILVNGATYRPFQFIKLLRKTKDGAVGTGIISENNESLNVAYLRQKFEKILLSTGGNKKGFLKAQNKLDKDAITALKEAWNNLYKNNTENVVVLNDGVDFKESSSSSVELQLNENKITDSSDIYKIFNIPVNFPKVTEDEYNNYIKVCILPILKALVTALNRDLLLDSEKDTYYFEADTKELLKGDMLKRFQAYQLAINSGIMTLEEVRYIENLEDLELNFLKLGLDSVLYNTKTKDIFVTNTGVKMNMETGIIDVNENINKNELESEVKTNNESGITQ